MPNPFVRSVLLSLLFLPIVGAGNVLAQGDLDLLGVPQPPNVMILLDDSASLQQAMWHPDYANNSNVFYDATACDGIFGNETFGDVNVPGGATCILNGTRVRGNVQVESGGALVANGVKVKGNIQTDQASHVQILDAKVGGNVQIDETSGTPPGGGSNQVCGSKIRGDLQVTKNTAPFDLGCADGNKVKANLQVQDNQIPGAPGITAIAVTHNKVGGNLQFQDNQSGDGDFDISDNRVRQNLQCTDNDAAPTGAGNHVRDDAEDQCAGLTAP